MQNLDLSKLLESLGRSSWQAGVLVVLVLLIQWALRQRLNPRWRSTLWLLVVARLLLPSSITTTISLFNWVPVWNRASPQPVPRSLEGSAIFLPRQESSVRVPPLTVTSDLPVAQIQEEPRQADTAASQPVTLRTLSAQPVATGHSTLTLSQVLVGIWLCGVLGLGSIVALATARLRRQFGRCPALTEPLLVQLLDSCRAQLGVRTPLILVESAEAATPALYGVFDPRLLLPKGFSRRFSELDIRFIFLHELAHLQRRDLALNWLITALQIAHWFNPLLWFGFYRWRMDRELACDALALEAAGPEQSYEYGRTILRLLEGFTHRTPAPGLVGILEDKRQLRQRIAMIASFRPARKARLLTLAFLVLLGLVCLTDAQAPKPKLPVGTQSSQPAAAGDKQGLTNELRVGADSSPALPTNLTMQTITLTVVDAETGKPLPNAEVFAPYIGGWKKPQPKRLTDENGRYVLAVPVPPAEARAKMAMFSLSAQHPDYAPRALGWTRSPGDVYQLLPKEATLRLEKGIPISGRVRDARGQPLAGVSVLLSGSGYRGFSMGTSDEKTHEYPDLQRNDKTQPAAVTDNSGQWTFAHFPSDLKVVEITLIRPDESKVKFSSSPGFNNVNQFAPVSLSDLRAGKAELALPDGLRVRGLVVDDKGHPVAGARVKEGYGHGNVELVSEFATDQDGRFERLNRAPRQWIYTASAEGKATVSVVAQVAPGMEEVRMILPPAKPLRLTVTDEAGHALPDCSVRLDSYRNEGQLLDWSGTTDSAGRLVWTNAPTQEVQFYFENQKLDAVRKFKAMANGEEKVLVLTKTASSLAVIKIKAVAQATTAPVKISSVSVEYNGDFRFKKLAEPRSPECRIEIRSGDFMVGMAESFRIKVEAEGYEPSVTEFMDLAEGSQEIQAVLAKASMADGVILLASGKPAAGARIWIQPTPNSGSLFSNQPGRYYGDRLEKVQVDNEGRFKLPIVAGNPPLVITHPDGLLETTFAELKKQREIHLLPWGQVHGRLLVAGQPKVGVRVNLTTLLWSPSRALHLSYSTDTSADGTFEFTSVPPGEYKVYRQPAIRIGRTITEDHPMPFAVKAGEKVQLEYAQPGRAVVGQGLPDKPDLAVDWQNDDHVLSLKQHALPAVNREDYASFKAFVEANSNSYSTPERVRQARDARSYVLGFQKDGSFRIEDVPPGTYELKILLTKPDQRDQFGASERPENQLGSLVKEVIIPAGEGPFDLGTVTVPMTDVAGGAKLQAMEFEVQTLEGQPLRLSQFRGKLLALVFWANWSERSKEQLAALKLFHDQFSANPRVVLLSVCMDGDLAKAKQTVLAGAYPGQQAFAEKSRRTQITQAFNLETLPGVFLLDENGRVVGRDLDGESLKASLRRLIEKQQARK